MTRTNGNHCVQFLFDKMAQHNIKAHDLSVVCGLHQTTISGWRYRHQPKVVDLEAALNCFGYTLSPQKTDIPDHFRVIRSEDDK